jgi:hypothetical protein
VDRKGNQNESGSQPIPESGVGFFNGRSVVKPSRSVS